MDVTLWIGQGILAAVFTVSGVLKLAWPKQRLLASGQTGVRDVPLPGIRAIAVAELLAVAGLILPGLTGMASVLTPLAALGLAVVMVGAGIVHTRLGEARNVVVNVVLLLMCVAVAAGRLDGPVSGA